MVLGTLTDEAGRPREWLPRRQLRPRPSALKRQAPGALSEVLKRQARLQTVRAVTGWSVDEGSFSGDTFLTLPRILEEGRRPWGGHVP